MPNDLIKEEVFIAICAHENAGTIERTINSVLSQTFTNWRLGIIVSKSADTTLSKCREFSDPRIEVIEKKEQQSWATSSIEAVYLAKTKYFMWLDADDFIDNEWLNMNLINLKDNNCYGSIGRIVLSNDGGTTLIDNISNTRDYRFAKSNYSIIRLFWYLFLPESYGAVNILYSIWETEFLKKSITWGKSEKSLDFDTEFILNILSRSRIYATPDTFLVRENQGFNNHVRLTSSKEILRKSYRSGILTMIWQLCVTKPRFFRYLNWARRNPKFIFLVLPIIVLRSILSLLSPLLITTNLRIRKLLATA